MRARILVTSIAIAVVMMAGIGCSSSATTSTRTSSQPSSPLSVSSRSPVVEAHPPGDIPDNQAFVSYAAPTFRVSVPEGWARSTTSGGAVFSDKYNRISLSSSAAKTAPTVQSATRTEIPAIKAASRGFVAGAVTAISRPAGPVVLITYRALSPVNPVTGKVANEAVERYEFWRNGHEAVVTLAAPVGSDNVDPWRKITESFTWTQK